MCDTGRSSNRWTISPFGRSVVGAGMLRVGDGLKANSAATPIARPTAPRKPNIPIGMNNPTAMVTTLMTSTAMPTRLNRLARSEFRRSRSRRAASRTGPPRSSSCRVTRSNRAIALSTLSVTSVTSPQSASMATLHLPACLGSRLRREQYSPWTSRLPCRACRPSVSCCRAPAA